MYYRGFAPSLSSSDDALKHITEIYKFKENQVFADFGCGTGKIISLLKNLPIKIHGYELNPVFYLICRIRFRRYKNITIHKQDFLKTELNKFDVVYIYGIGTAMKLLEIKLKKKRPKKTVIISNKFLFKNYKYKKNINDLYLYNI